MSQQFDIVLFNQLPDKLKEEVMHFIEFLFQKNKKNIPPPKKVKAGFLKGVFKMKEGFFDELEDFNEYK